MRVRRKGGAFSVHAIAGTYVVLLGIDAEEAATRGLLGFAIHRTDHTEDEAYWLKGFRTFKATDPDPVPGSLVSTLEHPLQTFFWGDYTAKSGHKYTYRVVPLYGKPQSLRQGNGIRVTISTEDEDQGTHAVYFNRGVAGSQAYALRFGNRRPSEVPGAYVWLSRGLEEAMLAFIGQAKSRRYGLRAAFYEFSYPPVLDAFGEAARRGADVKIIYDGRRDQPGQSSDGAIEEAGIRNLMIRRTVNRSYISHNKFIVLLERERPVEIWTGSTNVTEGGIFGQSNVGHIVRDRNVAQNYLDYWQQLATDPPAKTLRRWNAQAAAVPAGEPKDDSIIALFSPRTSLDALHWYADRMDSAKETVCFTAAFGVNPVLTRVLAEDKPYLRYVLLEKPGNNIEMISRDRDTRIAIGATIDATGDELHRWLGEKLTGLNTHVRFVHTKYMLIDPLSTNPTVITGSANFSEASTRNNDENMLIIRGNNRVADLYLGEFLRLFNHFYFREIVKRQLARVGSNTRARAYLAPDDSWCKPYYRRSWLREKQRLLFR